MRALLATIKNENTLSKTLSIAVLVGIVTILIVLNVDISNNPLILSLGDFLGSTGNLLFLIISNMILIGWAWRNQLRSVIKLALGVDLAVLILVQSIKRIDLGSWNIRPHGGIDGFPSGHATHAFAMAFLLTMFFPRFSWLWYLCAAMISWSRIETGSHNGFQIGAGIVLGTGIAWIFIGRWYKNYNATLIKSQSLKQGRTL